MAFRTTIHPAAQYPPTYMEQFCKALHPNLEMGKVCVAWFRQAINHCTDLWSEDKTSTACFWTTVKNFIFPDRSTELVSQKVIINVNPNRLSVHDCQSLFLNIVNDYVQLTPRYVAEFATNIILWRVLYSLFGLMVLGTLFLGTIYTYYRCGQTKKIANVSEKVFKSQERMKAIAARSLRLAKAELRILKTKQVARREDILAMDGSNTLVLKVATKYEFLQSIVQGSAHSVGKFHRLYDQHGKEKADFKIESINKAMQFLGTNCHKLHMLIMFEADKKFEMEEAAIEQLKRNVSPPDKISPRSLSTTPRKNFSKRLEGGSAWRKQSVGASTDNSDLHSSAPKQTNTPRSANTPRSSIPRNVQKALPSARKSK